MTRRFLGATDDFGAEGRRFEPFLPCHPSLHTESSSLSLKGTITYRTVEVEKVGRVAPGGWGRRKTLPSLWATSLSTKLRGMPVHLIQG